jgi:hypothetical protein
MQALSKIATSAAVVAALVAAFIAPGTAHAVVVQIDSQQNGSYVAGGPQYLLPGSVAQAYNPVQLTLAAGTYVITNAAGSGYWSAWNFNGSGLGSSSNWVWGFVMAEHGGNIIEDAYTGDVLGSQAAVAAAINTTTWNGNTQLAATSTAGFTDTFTLAQTTTLDFYVDDYNWGLGDNYGGVAIDISPVPEAGTAALMALGLLAAVGLRRRRI